MTCLALGPKWGFGSPFPSSAKTDCVPPIRAASAAVPSAFFPRVRNCRRVSARTQSSKRFIWTFPSRMSSRRGAETQRIYSLLCDSVPLRPTSWRSSLVQRFVEVQQLVAHHGPGRELRGVERGVGFRFAHRDQRLGVLGLRL